MLLAIDTSQMQYSVATEDGTYIEWDDAKVTLFEKLDAVDLSKITGICICIGPGRFSGIRSGLSFALGLSRSLSIPVYPINSFEVYASAITAETFTIAIDARKDQGYVQSFHQKNPSSSIELLSMETIQEMSHVYDNLGIQNQISVNAKDLLALCQNKIANGESPTEPEKISAIYIRPSVT